MNTSTYELKEPLENDLLGEWREYGYQNRDGKLVNAMTQVDVTGEAVVRKYDKRRLYVATVKALKGVKMPRGGIIDVSGVKMEFRRTKTKKSTHLIFSRKKFPNFKEGQKVKLKAEAMGRDQIEVLEMEYDLYVRGSYRDREILIRHKTKKVIAGERAPLKYLKSGHTQKQWDAYIGGVLKGQVIDEFKKGLTKEIAQVGKAKFRIADLGDPKWKWGVEDEDNNTFTYP